MLKLRIFNTLKFFDLQDTPLTLLELHKFLLSEKEILLSHVDTKWEVVGGVRENLQESKLLEVLSALQNELRNEVEEKYGYYCLKGRSKIIEQRLDNYFYGFKREKIIKRYLGFVRHIPFIRAVAIGGSQALGQQKENSDIDLLIFTDSRFMWLGRTLVSLYFQILGVRRYKNKTKNRFCLNHYLARPKAVDREKNLYKAMEYVRLRPVFGENVVAEFQQNNMQWLGIFSPNFKPKVWPLGPQSFFQRFLEKLLSNSFGLGVENFLKRVETSRIKQDSYTFILPDELSFHPESRHVQLLNNFFTTLL